MNQTSVLPHGGQILVEALKIHGVELAFCVPGKAISLCWMLCTMPASRCVSIVCRQEGGAAFMAEAYGKLTGRPGICFVTRGPGATNASIGVHTAFQDSSPMILFIGQIGGDVVEREAFQEIDYRRMFGQMTKWVAQIDRVERIPEYLSHAFHIAVSGRPGPVVLALPEDMLAARAEAVATRPYARSRRIPVMADMSDRLRELLAGAATAGHSRRWGLECAGLRRYSTLHRSMELAGGLQFPPSGSAGQPPCQLHRRDRNRDQSGIGEARPRRRSDSRYRAASGRDDFEWLHAVRRSSSAQSIVHIHPGVEELGRVYQAELMINAGMEEFAAAAAAHRHPSMRLRGREWTQSRARRSIWRRSARSNRRAH